MRFKDKTNQEKLKTLLKSNQGYRIKKALSMGYSDSETYIKALREDEPEPPLGSETLPGDGDVKIHNIHILDSSGSMRGEKFDNAYEGIKYEIEELKRDKSISYYQTLAYFYNDRPLICNYFTELSLFRMPSRISLFNVTPLYDTIVKVLEKVVEDYDASIKYLVKIFTDGEDNNSNVSIATTKRLIKECEKLGITITFVGVKEDIDIVQDNLGILNSNTLIHDNTPKGIKEAFSKTLNATLSYSKKVVAKEDVLEGFYKTTGTL